MHSKKPPYHARLLGGIILTLLLIHAQLSFAQNAYWNSDTSGYWFDSNNWRNGALPRSVDTATITGFNSNVTYTFPRYYSPTSQLSLDMGATLTVTDEGTGPPSIFNTHQIYMGSTFFPYKPNTLNIEKESGVVSEMMYIGIHANNQSVINISENAHLFSDTLTVGDEGMGIINQTGHTLVLVDSLTLGENETGVGIYNVQDTARLQANTITVGKLGKGTFTQEGGEVLADTMVIGNLSKVEISGGTIKLTELENKGVLKLDTTGSLVANTFTNDASGTLVINANSSSTKSFITLTGAGLVNLSGTVAIDYDLAGGLNKEFTLFSGVKGESTFVFDFLEQTDLIGFHWEGVLSGYDYLVSLKTDPSPVPIPSTMLLLGSALALLTRRRRVSIQ